MLRLVSPYVIVLLGLNTRDIRNQEPQNCPKPTELPQAHRALKS